MPAIVGRKWDARWQHTVASSVKVKQWPLQPRHLPVLGMSPGKWFLIPAKYWDSLLQSLKQGQC